jgi:glucosyl-dolichyl phosphate glucuronosyltransferase
VTQTVDQISVVICAYTEDRFHDLIAAVESVQRQTIPPLEVIVVIDHNAYLLEQVQIHIPDIIAIENSEQQGLSGARNSGTAIAQGALIAYLDDDAIAEPDWLARLIRCCTDPKVLGVGGTVEPRWLNKKPCWFPEEFYWVVGCTYRGMPRTITKIRNPIGANMALRREVLDTVGGFRNKIGRVGTQPVGCEETELCIRACQHWPQGVFLYQPQACVSHRVPSNRATWRYFGSRCYAEGLSKAIVSRSVGVKDSLSSESVYILRTLPLGVLRSLADALFHGDPTGFLRVGAIIAGLTMTIAGYLRGEIKNRC